MIRNNFYNKIKTLIPNITHIPVNVLINELINSFNYFINIQFIKLDIFQLAFDVRKCFGCVHCSLVRRGRRLFISLLFSKYI